MPLEVTTRQSGNVVTLEMSGQITLGQSAARLRDAVNEALANGHRHIILELHGVPFIDSAGLGELVRSHAAVAHRGGKLKLARVEPRVQNLLKITRLLGMFEIHETEEAALSSF
jgi:anti-sigma B factor antagonist